MTPMRCPDGIVHGTSHRVNWCISRGKLLYLIEAKVWQMRAKPMKCPDEIGVIFV